MMSLVRSILGLLLGPSSATKQKDILKVSKGKGRVVFITYEDYMMGRDKTDPPSAEQINNATKLLITVNSLLNEILTENKNLKFYGISSGYRPASVNSKVKGAAKKSAHLSCEAVDLRDRADQHLGRYLLANPELLIKHGLYMESIAHTKGVNTPWVHLQIRPTKSGNRVFIP